MSREVRQLHKETASTIATGLMVNLPLNYGLMTLWDNWLGLTLADDKLEVVIYTTICMTVVAYTRVYTIRRYFSKQNAKEISESQG
jgi:hypothetical protein